MTYESLAAANREIFGIYNKQAMAISNAISDNYSQWEKMLAKSSIKNQIGFQQTAEQMSKSLADFEKNKAAALCGKITELTDEQDRELRAALDEINVRIQTEIRQISRKIQRHAAQGAVYAKEYYKCAEELYSLLIQEYEGENSAAMNCRGFPH